MQAVGAEVGGESHTATHAAEDHGSDDDLSVVVQGHVLVLLAARRWGSEELEVSWIGADEEQIGGDEEGDEGDGSKLRK